MGLPGILLELGSLGVERIPGFAVAALCCPRPRLSRHCLLIDFWFDTLPSARLTLADGNTARILVF
jgi:hypothetical protein